MNFRKSFQTFAWVLFATQAYSADFSVSAALDRQQVALNEQAVLSIVVSGSGASLPEPKMPSMEDFQVSNAGRAQNFTWINGQASASVTYQYVLTPLKEGHFKLPPVRVEGGGQTAETPELSLDVVKGDPSAVSAPAAPGSMPQERRPGRLSAGSTALFITGTVDKASAYVGEPVMYSFRLYNRMPLLSRPNYQPPTTSGFWSEDLPPQRNFTANVKGVPYNVTEVRQALFPTTAGSAKVGSAQLTVHLENLGGDPFSTDFFAQFFGRGEEKTLRTEPVSVHVKPLPEPKPKGFQGAVGQYSISAAMDKLTVQANQPITLTITVSGKGNIKSIPDMTMPEIASFRTFDANAATNIEKKDYQVSGSKVFKTVLIPSVSGDYQIPPIPFPFFDPEKREYRTVSTRTFQVHVTPGAAGSTPASPTYSTPTSPQQAAGVKMLGEDIRYIQTPQSLISQGKPLYRRWWVLLVNGLFILGALLAGLGKVYRHLFRSNERLLRFRGAAPRALEAKGQAGAALDRNEIKTAAGVLAVALREYLAAKLGSEAQALSLREVLNIFKAQGITAHRAEKVRNLWESLDLYQFAPAQARVDEMRKTVSTFEHVVEDLEKEIPWRE